MTEAKRNQLIINAFENMVLINTMFGLHMSHEIYEELDVFIVPVEYWSQRVH